MSCLMLSEFSPSDQIAVAQSLAGFVPRSYADLVALLDPPAKAPHPLAAPASPGAGGSNPFPVMESAA
jgi:hypothetical protein